MANNDFSFEIKDGFDYVIEEKGNMSTNLRKIKWGNGDYKIDIRKWYYKDGEEKCGRGVSLSDEGTDELVKTLCEAGYGDTKAIIDSIKNREDFKAALTSNNVSEEDTEEEEYYDPKELLSA